MSVMLSYFSVSATHFSISLNNTEFRNKLYKKLLINKVDKLNGEYQRIVVYCTGIVTDAFANIASGTPTCPIFGDNATR